jgi:methylglyoxal synthase
VKTIALYNVPMACNPATADFIVTSGYFTGEYRREEPVFGEYAEGKAGGE